jgi:membrane associated rhomboid family serine protease
MLLPIRTDSPLRRTPWMNWGLIAANIVAFLIQQLAPSGEQFTHSLSLRSGDPHLLNYLTYQFLHADGMHIAGNMLFLYIFGNNVNDRMGHWGYLAFYLAGGVGAGVGHVLSSDPRSSVIGASGAVSAVTGAYLVLLPRSHITMVYWFIIIGMIEIPSVWFIVLSFAWDFILGFSGMGGNVAHVAHITGSVFGFGISFGLLSVRLLPRDQFDLFALFQRWNRRRQYQEMVSRGFDPFGITPRGGRSGQVDPNLDRIQDLRARISEEIAHNQIEQAVKLYYELRAIDPQQVLSRQNQLDVANQLFAQDAHSAAADAYEGFLRFYPKYDQIAHVQLMLGLLYARYLNQPTKARENLSAALQRLSAPREVEIAREELAKLGGGPVVW